MFLEIIEAAIGSFIGAAGGAYIAFRLLKNFEDKKSLIEFKKQLHALIHKLEKMGYNINAYHEWGSDLTEVYFNEVDFRFVLERDDGLSHWLYRDLIILADKYNKFCPIYANYDREQRKNLLLNDYAVLYGQIPSYIDSTLGNARFLLDNLTEKNLQYSHEFDPPQPETIIVG